MTFMLARGDQNARALLQQAIRSRYGMRPLLVESLRLDLQGRRSGLFGLPLRVHIQDLYFGFSHWRRDESWQLLVLPPRKRTESFDSGAYYMGRDGKVETSNHPEIVRSYMRRLWAIQSLLLTPLTQEGVVLKNVADNERAFQASLEEAPDDGATLLLDEKGALQRVTVQRYHPGKKQVLPFYISPSNEALAFGELLLPKEIIEQWEGSSSTVYQVKNAALNPPLPLTEFTLQSAE
jgi:hypothetical protein